MTWEATIERIVEPGEKYNLSFTSELPEEYIFRYEAERSATYGCILPARDPTPDKTAEVKLAIVRIPEHYVPEKTIAGHTIPGGHVDEHLVVIKPYSNVETYLASMNRKLAAYEAQHNVS